MECNTLPGLHVEPGLKLVWRDLSQRFTIVELVERLTAIRQNISVITVSVCRSGCIHCRRWRVGEAMDTLLLPDGWNPQVPIKAMVVIHQVRDYETWMAAFRAGMNDREIPDGSKCVGSDSAHQSTIRTCRRSSFCPMLGMGCLQELGSSLSKIWA